jgi:hypothetical protein
MQSRKKEVHRRKEYKLGNGAVCDMKVREKNLAL